MLKYCNGNNATCASETEIGRLIKTKWGSSKYSCLAKTQPHFLVALMDCSQRTLPSQDSSGREKGFRFPDNIFH